MGNIVPQQSALINPPKETLEIHGVGKYKGEIKMNNDMSKVPHGKGELTYDKNHPNYRYYVGYFDNANLDGYGELTFREAEKNQQKPFSKLALIKGFFKKNQANGKMNFRAPLQDKSAFVQYDNEDENGNVSTYYGSFKGDQPDGRGIMKHRDGTLYSGKWKRSARENYFEGTVINPDGTVYIGKCSLPNLNRDGNGILLDQNLELISQGHFIGKTNPSLSQTNQNPQVSNIQHLKEAILSKKSKKNKKRQQKLKEDERQMRKEMKKIKSKKNIKSKKQLTINEELANESKDDEEEPAFVPKKRKNNEIKTNRSNISGTTFDDDDVNITMEDDEYASL